MPDDLQPEEILAHLEQGRLGPYYLFHGPDEFRMEQVLDRVRSAFIPESARDFNLEVLYADKGLSPDEIAGRARSLPFMSSHRLIIVRRIDSMSADQLSRLIPYLEDPTETTCLLFAASKANFSFKFYKAVRQARRAVAFEELKGRQVDAWVRRTAREMKLDLGPGAAQILQEIVGTRLRDLFGEMEKLKTRYGSSRVGAAEVKELAVQTRSYTIFELMNHFSARRTADALVVLNRYLEEEGDRYAFLGILGMLNREIRLLRQCKPYAAGRKRAEEAARALSVPVFAARRLMDVENKWSESELDRAFTLLYEADGRLKSGLPPDTVLEALVLDICG